MVWIPGRQKYGGAGMIAHNVCRSNLLGGTKTKLLIRSEATDGSTIFTDSSSYSRILTRGGGIVHSTTSAHFGSSSIGFNGSNQYLSLPYDSVFEFTSSTTFTFDAWVNFTGSTKARETMFGVTNPGTPWGYAFVRGSDSKINLFDYNMGPTTLKSSTTVSSGWIHIAFVNDATNVKIYIDGVEKASAASSILTALQRGSGSVWVGSNKANEGLAWSYFQGYMEAIRFSNYARWTTDFSGSLPTEPYTID